MGKNEAPRSWDGELKHLLIMGKCLSCIRRSDDDAEEHNPPKTQPEENAGEDESTFRRKKERNQEMKGRGQGKRSSLGEGPQDSQDFPQMTSMLWKSLLGLQLSTYRSSALQK